MSGRKPGNLEEKRGKLFFSTFPFSNLSGTGGEMTAFPDWVLTHELQRGWASASAACHNHLDCG